MFPLFETIRIENGTMQNLKWHFWRLEHTFQSIYSIKCPFILENIIVPREYRIGLVKLRLMYDQSDYECDFSTYETKKIDTLKIVLGDSLSYDFKFTNRDKILSLHKQKQKMDDILIVKDAYITDTSIANIAFFDGSKWITPENPILKGTTRERLINEGKIQTANIKPQQLKDFQSFKIFNAMIDFDNQNPKPISKFIS
jgi:4-amino-4-deoxychorismate lyase